MICNRRVSLLILWSLLFVMAGCSKTVSLHFRNLTDESVEIELSGPGYDDDDEEIGHIPPHGYFRHDIKIDKDRLPAHYELEAEEEAEFTINEYTPNDLYVDIFNDKLLISRDKPFRKIRRRFPGR